MTTQEAKAYLRTHWEIGVKCPCCGQMVKKYSRKLTRSMALGLISLYKQGSPTHIKRIESVNGGEFAQLSRWGLIQAVENNTTTKRMSGLWTITTKGQEFVRGTITVPKYCDTYNGQTLGFSLDTININDALGVAFDYREMMGASMAQAQREARAVSWIT